MRFTLLATAALALALPGFVAAQANCPPDAPAVAACPSPGATFPDLLKYLSLTDSQAAALAAIQQQEQQAVSQLYDQLSLKETALQTLLQATTPDPLSVGQTMIDIQNLQKQISQFGTASYQTQALAVLNQTQTGLLANLKAALQLQPAASQAVMLYLIPGPVYSTTVTGTVPPPVPTGTASTGQSLRR